MLVTIPTLRPNAAAVNAAYDAVPPKHAPAVGLEIVGDVAKNEVVDGREMVIHQRNYSTGTIVMARSRPRPALSVFTRLSLRSRMWTRRRSWAGIARIFTGRCRVHGLIGKLARQGFQTALPSFAIAVGIDDDVVVAVRQTVQE